jgi:hypothetical protein
VGVLVGVGDGVNSAGATVTRAGLATWRGGRVAFADGAEAGPCASEDVAMTKETRLPQTKPSATLTMMRGAFGFTFATMSLAPSVSTQLGPASRDRFGCRN